MRTYTLCLMLLVVMGWVACGDPQIQKETPANEVAADAGGLVDQATEPAKEAAAEAVAEAVADAGGVEKQGDKAPEPSPPEATLPDKAAPDALSTDTTLTESPASEPVTTPDEPLVEEMSGTPDAATETVPEQTVAEQPGPDLGPPLCPLSEDCKALETFFQQELARIQACTQDSDCGKSLAGTSCGCTRNRVAATNADLTCFEKLLKHGSSKGCDLGLNSTCDCPPTNGFACKNNRCSWNYINSP